MPVAEGQLEKFLTLAKVAESLGVTYETVRVWVARGKIKARRFPRGTKQETYRVSESEIEKVKARLAQGLPL